MNKDTLVKVIEEAFFNSNKPISVATGIGGVGEFVNVIIKEGFPADFALAHITIDKSYEEGYLYIIGKLKEKPMKEKALFMDLDGTIIKTKSGETFPKSIDDWEFISGVLPKIRAYKDAGYHVIIVTNQGGIESGHVSKQDFETKIEEIAKEIEQYIGQGVNYAYCGNMESYMRKPNPGMAYKFALELELNLRQSVMVGDMESDAKFAKNAYIGTYLDIKDFIEENVIR